MVTIRLARGGTNKRPFYHIVVTDSRNPRDGRYIERIGFYNPVAAGKDVPFKISNERIEYWLSKGAQPSDRVASLLKSHANTANTVEAKPAKQADKNTQTNNSAEESTL